MGESVIAPTKARSSIYYDPSDSTIPYIQPFLITVVGGEPQFPLSALKVEPSSSLRSL